MTVTTTSRHGSTAVRRRRRRRPTTPPRHQRPPSPPSRPAPTDPPLPRGRHRPTSQSARRARSGARGTDAVCPAILRNETQPGILLVYVVAHVHSTQYTLVACPNKCLTVKQHVNDADLSRPTNVAGHTKNKSYVNMLRKISSTQFMPHGASIPRCC